MLGSETKIDPREYDLFVGMDVDKKHISNSVFDHGAFMKTVSLVNEPTMLVSYVRRNYPGKKIAFAYEAGPTGYRLYDAIQEAGYPCLVLPSSMIPTSPGTQVKTNRLDSRRIGVSLRGGELRGIQVPTETMRELRHLVTLREAYVKEDVRFKCRIKSLFLFEGMTFPEGDWSQRLLKELDKVECKDEVRFKLDQLLKSLRHAEMQIKETTRELQRFCRKDKDLIKYEKLLRSIPGIGHTISVYLMARLGDYQLIRSGEEIASFFGMVPRERSTGEMVRRGSITKSGDGRVRNKLIQASWVAIQKDQELADFYERIYERNPKAIAAKKAIVAVARKICHRMACVLREQRSYRVNKMKVKEGTDSSRKDSIIRRTREEILEVR
jgi:transposase